VIRRTAIFDKRTASLALALMLLCTERPNSIWPPDFTPERFVFSDLREVFAKANEEKSGD
jgi:hypothetical protein